MATQYALIQTLLGWGCAGTSQTVNYGQKVLDLSKATGDVLLQLSAYTKLGWALYADRKYARALLTMQEGESILKQHMPNLPESAVGSFYSTYALVQANNGIDPDQALGVAINSQTSNEYVAFTIFTESAQYLEAAHTCTARGDSERAMFWLEKRIDPITLKPRPLIAQSERGRIEAINIMTRALLQARSKDMGQIIHLWTVGMKGAIALKNEQRYNEAIKNFDTMQAVWPGERNVVKLCALTEHW